METEQFRNLPPEEQLEVKRYAEELVHLLEGDTVDATVPEIERFVNNYGGVNLALEAYQQTLGRERELFIEGIRYALEDSSVKLPTKADMLFTFVNSSVNLTQLHDSIVRLSATSDLNNEGLDRQLESYFIKRRFFETLPTQ